MQMRIRVGQCWTVRFTKQDIAIRLEEERQDGGWIARVLSHGRKVVVKSESQLLFRCDENGIQTIADGTIPNRRSKALPPERKEPTLLQERPSMYSSTGRSEADCHIPPVAARAPLPLLDAAAMVLRESRKSLSTREIVSLVIERNLWESTGSTPWATLNAALNRDIQTNGTWSRFQKKERGKFSLQ